MPRQILIADPDPATAQALTPALRQRGFQVYAASDGSQALELAILRSPDLVLLDDDAPLVDARSFVRILRANPRTGRIPVVLMGTSVDADRLRLGDYLRKPCEVDEALARIEQVFRRVEAARAVSRGTGIQGRLAEVSSVDLLQLLALSRKTGRLTLEGGTEGEAVRGEIALEGGRVMDARCGAVVGVKALGRLLQLCEGQFSFEPGAFDGTPRIGQRVEEVVLDALRQADEWAALAIKMPAREVRVSLAVPSAAVPEALHPATAEVMALLAVPRTVQELLDRAKARDVDVLRALAVLLDRGDVRQDARSPSAPAPVRGAPLVSEAQLHALRRRLSRHGGRAGGQVSIGKILLAGGGPLARRAALARWGTLPGFTAERAGERVDFGTLGRWTLAEGVRLDLVALPSDPALAPLWTPLAVGALAVLLLAPAHPDGLTQRALALSRAQGACVGICDASAPPRTPEAPERAQALGAQILSGDPAAAMRELLGAVAEA